MLDDLGDGDGLFGGLRAAGDRKCRQGGRGKADDVHGFPSAIRGIGAY
jgi:hypothetical protein